MRPIVLATGLLTMACILVTGVVQAQPFPNHPIQLVNPGAPGDAADIAARAVGEELAKILKVPVIPINKPGAASTISADFVAKSKKDGYTLLYGNSSATIYAKAYNPNDVPYDPGRDLEPLGFHQFFPAIFSVQSEAPWKNFSEIIEYARKNPKRFRCGLPGVGSIDHMSLELIKSLMGVDITMIPFKGAALALTALMGGHIESTFVGVVVSYPFLESRKIRGILLNQKVAALPGFPTLHELGYQQDLPSAWFAFFAPAGIPEEAKKVLVPAIEKAIKNPELTTKLQKMWFVPNYKSPEELQLFLSEKNKQAQEIIKTMGATK